MPEFFIGPVRTSPFIFEDMQATSKLVFVEPLSFGMNSQRYERPKRKRIAILFSETDQCRVMMLSDSGQPALERRRNAATTQIKHDQTESP